ncbi:MAG: hypothetical protein JXB49_21730 [Bacteroidales bacterium]|nr:hypothetical protein [Bacteroidales bacterium]
MTANGPAIWGGCVTRCSIRAASRYPTPVGPEIYPGARQVWRAFCRLGANLIACRRGRGTSSIDGREIVQVNEAQKWHWRNFAM